MRAEIEFSSEEEDAGSVVFEAAEATAVCLMRSVLTLSGVALAVPTK